MTTRTSITTTTTTLRHHVCVCVRTLVCVRVCACMRVRVAVCVCASLSFFRRPAALGSMSSEDVGASPTAPLGDWAELAAAFDNDDNDDEPQVVDND